MYIQEKSVPPMGLTGRLVIVPHCTDLSLFTSPGPADARERAAQMGDWEFPEFYSTAEYKECNMKKFQESPTKLYNPVPGNTNHLYFPVTSFTKSV